MDELVMVRDGLLRAAAGDMESREVTRARLTNGVEVTPEQLRSAAKILREGPQPVCNGIKDDMPGFIHADQQTGKSLTFQVGILPSRTYRIDRLGRARSVTS